MGVTYGGLGYPWSSCRTLLPIMLGLAGMNATMVWERYGASKPFLRL